jgi:hypothetical protein
MIEETEIAGIVNKIHPFTLLLFWMRDKTIYGIYKLGHGHIAYFKLPPDVGAKSSREEILQRIHIEGDHQHPENLGFDQFVAEMKKARVRKVWLTRKGGKALDAVFVTLKELRDFLRSAPM